MEFSIPEPSNEQNEIITELDTKNVIVNSVVGAGKTSTVLQIAQNYPEKHILLLTYNKRLKVDTRLRSSLLENIEVHSFHSFCVSYYHHDCHTDYGLIKTINDQRKPFCNLYYDMIVIDESQDLNPLYYEIICKIYFDFINTSKCKICVIGDIHQSIYGYNLADERYILSASKLFNFNSIEWSNKQLTETFRLTKPITDFVNHCLLGEERIVSKKETNSMGLPADKPRYIICNNHVYNRAYQEVLYYLKKGYSYDDFFILAPSIKSEKSPVRKLANKLGSEGYPIYCPVSDDEKLDSDITQGKIVFCTFHQSKGLERRVVIVYNFDESYFRFYKRDFTEERKCPNELYVAVTRALDHVSLIHGKTSDYLDFIYHSKLGKYCKVEYQSLELEDTRSIFSYKSEKTKTQCVAVTELIRHLPIPVIEKALTYLTIEKVHDKEGLIDIPSKTQQPTTLRGPELGSIYENVSEITGVAIPSYYELVKTGKMSINVLMNQPEMKRKSIIYDIKSQFYKSSEMQKNTYDGFMFRTRNEKEHPFIDPEELLYLSNKWSSLSNGFNFKMKQIKRYTWLTQDMLNRCVKRLSKHLTDNAVFESFYSVDYELVVENNEQEGNKIVNRVLQGYIDCIDGNKIWEFKCVNELDRSAFLQLALYGFLIGSNKDLEYFLFNILDHKIYQIKISDVKLKELVEYLFLSKYSGNKNKSDGEFIKENLEIKKKYFQVNRQKKITQFIKNENSVISTP